MTPKQMVAANIRFLRKGLGLTQKQAAQRIGWEQPTWAEYEKGDKSIGIDVLADIARALETTMSELVRTDLQIQEKAVPKAATGRRRN